MQDDPQDPAGAELPRSPVNMRLYGEHHIRCPRCERRVVSVLINSVILWCATPVEVTARPGSETPLIVCPGCRELVPVDREVMRVL